MKKLITLLILFTGLKGQAQTANPVFRLQPGQRFWFIPVRGDTLFIPDTTKFKVIKVLDRVVSFKELFTKRDSLCVLNKKKAVTPVKL